MDLKLGDRVMHKKMGAATVLKIHRNRNVDILPDKTGTVWNASPEYLSPLEEPDTMEEAQWTDG